MKKLETIYFIKNIYKNVKGRSKIKIIDKDAPYICNVVKYEYFEIRFVIDNLGNRLQIDSNHQFYTANVRRDMIINNLFNEI